MLSDDLNLPFGYRAAVGAEFIPFIIAIGTKTMTIDKAQESVLMSLLANFNS